MEIYFYLLAFWIVSNVAISSVFKNDKNRDLLFILIYSTTLLALFSLRKWTVGTDTETYMLSYSNSGYKLYDYYNKTEIGFKYFNFFLNDKMGVDFQLYLFLIAAFFVIPLTTLIKRFSKNYLLSFYLHLTIGLFPMAMSGARQTIAISFTILSFILLLKGKKIIPFFLIIAGYFFHNSISIFFLAFPIIFLNPKLTKKNAFIIYFLSIIIFAFRSFMRNIVEYFNLMDYEGLSRYEKYLFETDFYTNPLVTIVAMFIPLACLIFWPKSILDKTKKEIHPLSIFFIFSCINFVFNYYSMDIFLFSRLAFYFMVYNIILIPNIIEGIENPKLRMWAKIACLVLPLIQFIMSTPGGALGIDNYEFFWE
jgi:hypothetical protein